MDMPITSYATTKDRDPYDFYEALHGQSGMVWDETLKAWLVSAYSLCREILRRDDIEFMMPERVHNFETLATALGGEKVVFVLSGKAHTKIHTWWLRAFSPQRILIWRQQLIRPIVHQTIDRFIERGSAELASEFGDLIAVRVIAATMDLPWQDDAWVSNCKTLNDEAQTYFERRLGLETTDNREEAAAVVSQAIDASEKLKEILLPFIRARRDGVGDDMISLLWRDGPSLIPGWGDDEVMANARLMFQAGSDTTSYATINICYLLLTRPELMRALREGRQETVARLVEELLRLHGPVHFRSREAIVDTEIEGRKIKRGDRFLLLVAAANRDGGKFPYPGGADPQREGVKEHLAFNYGMRTCVGAALARAELTEIVMALRDRLLEMRLDSSMPAPEMSGWLLRAFRPLHVTFPPWPQSELARPPILGLRRK